MKLESRVAIVTGAAMGIGRSVALELAKRGVDVVVADIESEQASKVVDEVKTLGRKAIAVRTDVIKSADAKQMAKTTLEEFGEIDILVNVAGQSARERKSAFAESTEEVWDFVFGLNLKGVLNCCRAVIEHMIQRRSGKIVNIASRCGVVGCEGLTDYSAAKAGVIRFSETLAKEVARYGINVNSVSPGSVETRDMDHLTNEQLEVLKKRTGWDRLGKPEDIAYMVAFLVSDEANFISGQNFIVCGPLLMLR